MSDSSTGDVGAALPGIPDDAVVLRVVRPAYVPAGQAFPTSEAFVPSDIERDDAIDKNLPVRVSVWDRELTTPEQAVGFREQGPVPPPVGGYQVFALRNHDVMLTRADLNEPRLRIVRDPDPSIVGPGASGHCGIEGLDTLKGVSRKLARAVRDELARRCRKVHPP